MTRRDITRLCPIEHEPHLFGPEIENTRAPEDAYQCMLAVREVVRPPRDALLRSRISTGSTSLFDLDKPKRHRISACHRHAIQAGPCRE